MFDDNMPSHRTDAVFKHISDELCNCTKPRFLLAKTTMIIQVINHHIGMQCKKAVCISLIKVIMERLDAARAAANVNANVIIEPLTPKEKRMLMTMVICDAHESVTESQTCFRAFVATEICKPINHMVT